MLGREGEGVGDGDGSAEKKWAVARVSGLEGGEGDGSAEKEKEWEKEMARRRGRRRWLGLAGTTALILGGVREERKRERVKEMK